MTYTIGQRWISTTESQLGLGIITDLQSRQVGLSFPAAEEQRIYSIENAPLSRIIYKECEEITTNEGQKIKVTQVFEEQGLIVYTGIDAAGIEQRIKEIALNCFITLNTPEQRLFSGLLDKLNSFKLRIDTLNHISRLQQSPVRGLIGSRTSHLPHQVYIAHEVAQRYAPRVLLADEVGLGKTIEAGMILHYQLHTKSAERILIVVPDTLIHQWLVELLRRFNLHFSILDQNRYKAIDKDKDKDSLDEDFDDDYADLNKITINDNLFENHQLVLCSLDFLMSHPKAHEQALEAKWDLLIVDEAHHLFWSPQLVSPEYEYIQKLATQSKGLLLLTATPEQVGIQSHFARLRLLDPARFSDLALFMQEEERYQEINELIQQLIELKDPTPAIELNPELKLRLGTYLGEQNLADVSTIIRDLLDRHGTGRVLFRNTRAAIQGFPQRLLHAYSLVKPAVYAAMSTFSEKINLFPETALPSEVWINHDPRVAWLVAHLTDLFPNKVLIICAKAQTAIALEQYLKLKIGIRSTVFHEGLTIIDRDKAAAYFAEEEEGAQTLICSEIGSEGRNFQFAHHLVLFDLPLNPDLLEQRIGRLDRIGQRHSINIHVPYLLNTAQEVLFRWYNEGINLFKESCSAGFGIYTSFQDRLLPLLEEGSNPNNLENLDTLINDTKNYANHLKQTQHKGRDKLLELNSCNLPRAQELIAAIENEENCIALENYMAQVFQEYAIEHEYHSEQAEILRPTDHMKTSYFPGLKEDGMTVTYSRSKALIREDMEFLSWEHPIVFESMEMILDSEVGKATLTTISVKSITPGTLFLESFYTINCAAPKELQLDRFIPLSPIRILMDVSGKNLSNVLSYTQLNTMCEPVKRHLGYPIIKQVSGDLEKILGHSNKTAELQMREIIEQAKQAMNHDIGYEVNRLIALQKINPAVRHEEIDFFKKQIIDSDYFIGSATLQLQALRVVVNK